MIRAETFAFRVSSHERCVIASLAERLSRSQSDAVRFVVIEVAKQLAQSENVSIPTLSAANAEKAMGEKP